MTHAPNRAITRRRFLDVTGAALTTAFVTRPVIAQSETVRLPIFPLPLVAFPGEHVPLHIFEPRYKQLLNECIHEGRSFGISTLINERLAPYGTEMELYELVREHDDGRLDVIMRGNRVYSLNELHAEIEGKLYSGADVTFLENDPSIDDAQQSETVELYRKFCRVFGQAVALPGEIPENLTFILGHVTRLSINQEVKLLSLPAERDRQIMLREHLRKAIADHQRENAPGNIAQAST